LTPLVPWSDPVDTPMVIAGTFLASSFMFFGVFVVVQRPCDRVGLLMVAVAFSFPLLAEIPPDVTYALGNWVFLQLWLVVLAHLFLAFPTGRLPTTFDRWLIRGAYGWRVIVRSLEITLI